MKLIIASNNEGKIREYKTLLAAVGYNEVLSLKDAHLECDPDETGKTFEENAAIKARALFEMCNCAVLADDSGLMVDALGGAHLGKRKHAIENAVRSDKDEVIQPLTCELLALA